VKSRRETSSGAELDGELAEVGREVVVVALEAMARDPELRRERVQLLEVHVARHVAPVLERQPDVGVLDELVDHHRHARQGTSAAGEPDDEVGAARDLLVAEDLRVLELADRADEVEPVEAQQRVPERGVAVAVGLGAGAERALQVVGADRLLRVLLVRAAVVERVDLERVAGLRLGRGAGRATRCRRRP
jgi:hypothetical protein